jgi:hypothetical protein
MKRKVPRTNKRTGWALKPLPYPRRTLTCWRQVRSTNIIQRYNTGRSLRNKRGLYLPWDARCERYQDRWLLLLSRDFWRTSGTAWRLLHPSQRFPRQNRAPLRSQTCGRNKKSHKLLIEVPICLTDIPVAESGSYSVGFPLEKGS